MESECTEEGLRVLKGNLGVLKEGMKVLERDLKVVPAKSEHLARRSKCTEVGLEL